MKKLLFLLGSALLMAACVKQPEQPEQIRFSILGDSYSTYEGYVHPDSNDVYPYDEIGLTGVEQMWWARMANSTGWTLERNNSFSGALVCNFNYVNYYGQYSFIRRMDNLGQPDVIFIFGATNDAYAHDDEGPIVPLGDYIYSNWTEEQLCEFRPGLAYLFENLQTLYPKAKLYFLLDMNLGTDGIDEARRAEFITSIHRIANHYGVECIDLTGIHKSRWHPDAQGHKDIARQVIEVIETDFNV